MASRLNRNLVSDPNHIARYCKPKQIVNNKIQPSAFMLRENESSLSVNWLENVCGTGRNNQLKELRNIYRQKGFNIKASAQFAVLNVGEVREKVKTETTDKRDLQVIHESPCDVCTFSEDEKWEPKIVEAPSVELHQSIPADNSDS